MSSEFPDRRTNAYRDDLAADYLQGKVSAATFVKGEKRQVVSGDVQLRQEPRHDAALDTELLHGDLVTVYDENEGWAWVQADRDSYVGYLSANALVSSVTPPTHRVRALRTHLYPVPDFKAPPLDLLSMNSRVAVDSSDDHFARLVDGRFAVAGHLAQLDVYETDFVDVAAQFLGTPYLWGGRTSIGIDCSALIQLALQATGVDCPRDTDMQEAALGNALADPRDHSAFTHGDLVFWRGHMGVMLDRTNLLHANVHHMAVANEPVAKVIERFEETHGPVTSVRRLDRGR